MSKIYSIDNITINTIKIVTQMEIIVLEIVLFTSVKLRVILYDCDKSIVNHKIIELKNEDYSNWKNDDSYIIDYVKSKI